MLSETHPAPSLPTIVLDTNAVLDAWLFKDDCMAGVLQALMYRRIVWVASPAMRNELVHTLLLPNLQSRQAQAMNTVAGFDQHALLCPEPTRTVHRQLWCSDNDDQMFMDLALARGARWLLTKDRALLKLRRRASSFGVQILQPALWLAASDMPVAVQG